MALLEPTIPREYHLAVGLAHYSAGKYALATTHFEQATQENLVNTFSWILLAATYGHVGNIEQAEKALAAISAEHERVGGVPLQAGSAFTWPFKESTTKQRFYEDLKLAGVPDATTQVAGELIGRQLTPAEVKELVVPSRATGVMVEPSGRESPFTWSIDAEANVEFYLWGQTMKVKYRFENDMICNERGCSEYFELTEVGVRKWRHSYVIKEQTGMLYYVTILDDDKPAP